MKNFISILALLALTTLAHACPAVGFSVGYGACYTPPTFVYQVPVASYAAPPCTQAYSAPAAPCAASYSESYAAPACASGYGAYGIGSSYGAYSSFFQSYPFYGSFFRSYPFFRNYGFYNSFFGRFPHDPRFIGPPIHRGFGGHFGGVAVAAPGVNVNVGVGRRAFFHR